MRLRVLVADDHPLYLFGMRRIVDAHPELELVAAVRDGRKAVAVAVAHAPDLAILDFDMPRFGGLDVLRAFGREGLPTRVLALADTLTPDLAYTAVEAGVHGLLAKDAHPEEIGSTLLTIAAGVPGLSLEAQVALTRAVRDRRERAGSVVTEQETELLHALADGLSARAIARSRGLDPALVKDELLRIYARFGVTDRAAAVAEALRRGLIE